MQYSNTAQQQPAVSVRARRTHPDAAFDHRLAVSIPEAGTMLGIGRTSVYDLLKRGELKSIKIGRRHLVAVSSIRAFADISMGAA